MESLEGENDEMNDMFYSDVDDDDDHVIDDNLANYEVQHDAHKPSKSYTILKESDIRREMDVDVMQLCSVLSISKLEASILLRHFNWSISKVNDAWFTDESQVRRKVGLLSELCDGWKPNSGGESVCGICFESYDVGLMTSAVCGHGFCVDCWKGYIGGQVSEGAGCLLLKCPQPKCNAAVAEDMVDVLANENDQKKYHSFLVRSFIEDNRKRKWCPAPNCECAIEFSAGGDDNDFDVTCVCSHSFCWKCTEEPHRPVDCETVSKWRILNESESGNETWKKAFTKNCPKCNKSIEKNEGCMHMTCILPCGYEFCWICLGSWRGHGSCNRYRNEDQMKESKKLQAFLDKYQHYYDRWAANHNSRSIAQVDLHKVESEHIQKLSRVQGQAETQLGFLVDAWKQIVECRRVLKWTYAYGYYLNDNENAKKEFFEYLQGQAESALERLHHESESKLKHFLSSDQEVNAFNEFRKQIAGLTKVTKTYFDNLVRALENGLSDINEVVTDNQGAGSSSSKKDVKRKYSRITTKHSNPRRWRVAIDNLQPVADDAAGNFFFLDNVQPVANHTAGNLVLPDNVQTITLVAAGNLVVPENVLPATNHPAGNNVVSPPTTYRPGGNHVRSQPIANRPVGNNVRPIANCRGRNLSLAIINNAIPVANNRAGNAVLPEIVEEAGPWTCSYCTFINPTEAVMCQVCGRGGWPCPGCSYANSRLATACEMCQEARVVEN